MPTTLTSPARVKIVRAVILVAAVAALLALPRGLQAKGDADANSVTISGMAFNPGTIKVKVGDTVTWTNADDRDHSVNAADGSFKSGNLGHGQSFSFRFTAAGTFAYSCGYHPRMHGVVVVQ